MKLPVALAQGAILYAGGAGNGPIAGEFCNVHIRLPAGSPAIAFLYRVRVDNVSLAGSVNGAIVAGAYDTALAGAAYSARSPIDRRITTASFCQIAGNSDPSPAVLPAAYAWRNALVLNGNDVEELPDSEPIAVLTAGQGYVVHATFTSMDLDAVFTWAERRI